jgi:hypothetical protein
MSHAPTGGAGGSDPGVVYQWLWPHAQPKKLWVYNVLNQ